MAGTVMRCMLVVALMLLASVLPLSACPFCGGQGQTLTGEVNEAGLVLYGTLGEAKLDPKSDFGQGSTKFNIEAVLKNHEVLGNKKEIILPRYLPTDEKTPKYLIFAGVFKGKIDPYRGVPVKSSSDIVKYLMGALAVKDKPVGDRLRFSFDYLDNADIEISNDAYKEFANADYRDYSVMAKGLPAAKIARWLEDPETPSFRFGLYSSLIGHCGSAKDAALLRKLLDEQRKRLTSGLDGLLAGYTMLNPKEGWEYVRGILGDPKKEFMLRYSALRSARFFWEYRSDLVSKDDLVKGVSLLLDQNDIADLAIEDLRKWSRWEAADQIVGLYDRKSHDIPIVRRAILRYALCCKDNNAAAALVKRLRQKDPELVTDAEELLKLETANNPKPANAK